MIAIVSLLLIVCLSILITRVASIALTYTGLARESARFQARSAFTGTGFTTTEAEQVVNNPVRRRIVMLLMLLGNAGLVTAVSSLILTFVGNRSDTALWLKIVALIAGLALLWYLAQSKWVDHYLSRVIEFALRRYTRLDVRDYVNLMHLSGEYRIIELHVEKDDWLANKTLAQTRLRDEGVVVLAIRRYDGTYIGAPKGDKQILPGDVIVLYGRTSSLQQVDQRQCTTVGDQQHKQAMAAQKQVLEKEKQIDPAERAQSAAETGASRKQ